MLTAKCRGCIHQKPSVCPSFFPVVNPTRSEESAFCPPRLLIFLGVSLCPLWLGWVLTFSIFPIAKLLNYSITLDAGVFL
jgi:hypothetical protein